MDCEELDDRCMNSQVSEWSTKVQGSTFISNLSLWPGTEKKQFLDFLLQLRQALSQKGSAADVLAAFPSVGQLLGRVVTLPALTSDPALCEGIVSCLLTLYNNSPQSSVQQRANTWVISQIRHLCSGSQSSVFSRVQEVTGCSVSDQLTSKLKLCGSVWSGLGESDGSSDLCTSSNSQTDSSEVALLHSKNLRLLEWSELDNDQTITGDIFTLIKKKRILHWRKDRRSLEQCVLTLLSDFMELLPGQETGFMKSEKAATLVHGCAIHMDLYTPVFLMLRQLHQDSESSVITRFIHRLHQNVSHYINSSDLGPDISVVSLFPGNVQSLVQLLQVDPKELSQSVCQYHVTQISRVYTKLQSRLISDDLTDLQLKYLSWKFTSLVLCLLGNQEVLDETLKVVEMFYGSKSISWEPIKGIALILRKLASKSHLTTEDIEGIPSQLNFPSADLVGQLLLFFLVMTESSFTVGRALLNRVPSHGVADTVVSLVDTVEIVSGLCPVWVRDRLSGRSLGALMSELCSDAMDSGHSEKVLQRCTERLRCCGVMVERQ